MANELEKTTEETNNAPAETQKAPDDGKRVKELEAEIAKLKQAVTNASADASKYKKELQAKQTDEERATAEREAAEAAKQAELDELRTKWNVSEHEKNFMQLGFDAELAKETAEAMKQYKPEELETLFGGIRKFIESHDKQMAEKALLNNPKLPGGNSTRTVTREEFKQMGYREMVAFKNEHPELFAEYTK